MVNRQKPTICLDFDGVVNSYESGYDHATYRVDYLPDPPTVGAAEAIATLRRRYRVVIYSTRCNEPNGRNAIIEWLAKHNIRVDEVASAKPPAMMYVDDRAILFEGDWDQALERIANYRHWFMDDFWDEGEDLCTSQ